MAKIIYQKYQNKNMESRAYQKWYARTKSIETLNTALGVASCMK